MTQSLMSKVANALSFAHLAGLGRPAAATEDEPKPQGVAAASEDDPAKKRDDETADEYATRMDTVPADEDDKEKKEAAAAATQALAQAKAEGVAEGVQMERSRGAAIFASPAAARNVSLAAELAFTTDLSAERAAALLDRAPATTMSRPDRVARNPAVGTGTGPAATPQQAAAARWDANLKAAAPKARS